MSNVKKVTKDKNLRIIPLGGLGEVGRNMILFEYRKAILIVDMGLGFPGEDMPGIDCTIPNITSLKGREKNILGAILTHGHYDHIGAIPYLLPKIGPIPLYASSLTKGMILKRQEDFSGQPKLKIKEVKINFCLLLILGRGNFCQNFVGDIKIGINFLNIIMIF